MSKVNIFVCCSDVNKAVKIKNPIFKYIQAGASINKNKDTNYLKDNVGDNISSKNPFYNELTVQYWMWKNIKSDYYGLCHYRRFISFSEKHYETIVGEHELGLVGVPLLSNKIISEHNLDNKILMEQEISKYDLICMEPISVKKYFPKKNMYETYKAMPLWHNYKDIDNTLEVIKKLYPEMYKTAHNYFFKGKWCYYYNCWIMNKNLFEKFSKFLFDILFELENKIDYTHYSKQLSRALGLIGERLFGIFVEYIEKQKKYKIKRKQVIFVQNPEVSAKPVPFKKHSNVPIVTMCNDFYIPYFSVLLASLIKYSSPNKNYDFIVICDYISKENKKKIEKMLDGVTNISIRFYNPKYEMFDIKFYNNSNTVTTNTYHRLFVPWILENYDKAIVLDADLVFNHDPSDLYNINVKNYFIGAAKDAVFQSWLNGVRYEFNDYATNYMGLKNPYNYVNTGVMVMNLKYIRQVFSFEKFIQLNTIKPYRIREQDSINVIFQGKIKFISLKWNFYLALNDFLKNCIPHSTVETYNEYLQASKDPFILHWAAYPKPWINPNIIDADIWWLYSKTTPFYEICLQRLTQNVVYHNPSFLRRVVVKLAPPSSKRRAFLKMLLWKDAKTKLKILNRIYNKIVK